MARLHDGGPTGPPAHLGLGGSCDVTEMYATLCYRLIRSKRGLSAVCRGVSSREKSGWTWGNKLQPIGERWLYAPRTAKNAEYGNRALNRIHHMSAVEGSLNKL